VSSAGDVTRSAAREDAPRGVFHPAYRLISLSVIAMVTIVAFEFMAISTAMPAAAAELGALRSYGLAFSVMLTAQLLGIVLAGVWADRSGPMPGLYAGQLLFAAGAAVCGLSTSFPMLLAGRAVTGLGAGLVVVVLYVVIGRVYPADTRPRVFAWISAAWVLPSLVGAPLSGWLTTVFSWRLVFWVVVPPALLTLGLIASQRASIARGPADDEHDEPSRAQHRRTAVAGVLVAVAAGLVQLGTYEPAAAVSWNTAAALAGVAGLALVAPRLLPPGTARMARGLPSVIFSRFFLNGAFNGAITYVPLMVTQERGSTVFVAGAVLAIGSFGWSTGSWVQGQARFSGRRWLLVSTGGALLTAGVLTMVVIAVTGVSVWFFAPAMVLAGLGMGLGSTSLSVLVLDLVPTSEQSPASAALQLSDVLGSVVGIAGASAIFAALHTAGGDRHTYVAIWVVLSGAAAVCVVSGRRCRPVSARARDRVVS
jgi:MFS family permease